jgi:hypothetical protein
MVATVSAEVSFWLALSPKIMSIEIHGPDDGNGSGENCNAVFERRKDEILVRIRLNCVLVVSAMRTKEGRQLAAGLVCSSNAFGLDDF